MEASLVAFLSKYRWLLDTYVIEFFTEDHWAKLPQSWRETLSGTDLEEASQLLLSATQPHGRKLYPLSLLAFSATARALSAPREHRTPINDSYDTDGMFTSKKAVAQVEGLDHSFRRHVKPKKQHEIKLLGEVIYEMSCRTKCRNIIDVGSGQGHLARYLAFNYGLHVTALEAVGCRLTAATKFDSEVGKEIARKTRKGHQLHDTSQSAENVGNVRHIETLISPEISASDLLVQVGLGAGSSSGEGHDTMQTTTSQEQDVMSVCPDVVAGKTDGVHVERHQRFILVGLHTCGDLASTMFRMFSCSEQIAGLVSVGCCYMRLTSSEEHQKPSLPLQPLSSDPRTYFCDKHIQESLKTPIEFHSSACSSDIAPQPKAQLLDGYPMSTHVRSLPGYSLSYQAREVACHSIETYLNRCQGGEQLEHLKIHCHRAAVETVLRKHGMRRAQVRISRRVSKLPFEEYAQVLMQSVSLPPLTTEDLQSLSRLVTSQWEDVAKFFMLRLALAPCVETLILLDRVQFLKEQGYGNVQLVPVFDPTLSPRNLVVLATSL